MDCCVVVVALAEAATWLGETFGGGAPLTIWSILDSDILP